MKHNVLIGAVLGIWILQGCTSYIPKSIEDQKAVVSRISEEEVDLAEYLAEDKESLHLNERFILENYYITKEKQADSYYYIDGEHTLWGYGSNFYGQLGIGDTREGDSHQQSDEAQPKKIAENVIHVDCGGYFTIYLSEDGTLYGMGANPQKIEYSYIPEWFTEEEQNFFSLEPTIAFKPIPIMKNVTYARCGMGNMVILKNDGSVWCWGEFKTTSSRVRKPVESFNYKEPTKILEDAVYVTCGSFSAGAIKRDGSLWTWGNNTFGSCGTQGGDYIEEPRRVLENVKMVWFDSLQLNAVNFTLAKVWPDPYDYSYVTFAELTDGTFAACGMNVRGSNSVTSIFSYYGDIIWEGDTEENQPPEITYSESFEPIQIVEKNQDK